MAFLAGLTVVMLARSLVPGFHERRMAIAPSAAPAARRQRSLAWSGQIENLHAGIGVENHGADGDFQDQVVAGFAVAIGAFAMAAAIGAEFAIVAVAQQCVVVGIGFEIDVAAIAAVAARWAAAGDVFLATERDAAVAAIAALHRNFGFVNEHGYLT